MSVAQHYIIQAETCIDASLSCARLLRRPRYDFFQSAQKSGDGDSRVRPLVHAPLPGICTSPARATTIHERGKPRERPIHYLYISQCSACHQVNGEGLPDVFPPLKGSGVVNKDDAAKHIHVVLYGMQGGRAGGLVYAAAMPPFAGTLSDADIADIIDYERSSWGNHGKPVAVAQVAAERSSSR
jgi:cytochrome c553